MKKILLSLIIIGAVGAIVAGVTTAYFSSTETSGPNVFTAGTVDIYVEGDNFTWEGGAELADMKPCYTDYINFTIYNTLGDPNPVNVWKTLDGFSFDGGALSEPECIAEGGSWIEDPSFPNDPSKYSCSGNSSDDEIDRAILYDLLVEVYRGNNLIWWQTIYDEDIKLDALEDVGMYLGMIPADCKMKVSQSYHMEDTNQEQNWAQGDEMTFTIGAEAIQLRGEAWLENKDTSNWQIIHNDLFEGTLTYKVKHPTFDFSFTGKAPQIDHDYELVAITDIPNDKGVLLGIGTSLSNGDIAITGDLDTGHIKDAKVWLVTASDFDATTGSWTGYHPNDYLWEAGLIWYEDTDL